MQELLSQLLDQARGMWRFRRPALVAAWIICVLGWIVVLTLPPVYEAKARIYVDTSAVLRPLLQGIAVEQDITAQLNYVRQALLSRPQLEKVARDTDLDLQATTPQEKEALIDSLRERVQIGVWGEVTTSKNARKPQAASSLYQVSFQDPKRGKALKVVQELVNSFVEDSLGGKRSGSDAAQKFLEAQIADYQKRLGDSEQQLAEFKRNNAGLVPGTSGDYFSRMQAESEALAQAQANLKVALQRRDELQRQLRGESAYTPMGKGGKRMSTTGAEAAAGGNIELRIGETQRALDAMLMRYTDKHPDVVAARKNLEDLKAQQQAEIDALRRGEASTQTMASLSANPVYQQIQAQLNQANVDVVAAQSQVGVHQAQIAQFKGMMNTAPEVEAEYSRLTRDYETTRTQYNELVGRLGRARISEDAEQTGVVRFEVIDPPNVGVDPIAPDRPRLLALVLAVGLAAALALAFVLHQLKPVFTSTVSLGDITGLPVLGAVSRTWRERHRAERRQELLKVSMAAAGLLLVFGLVMLVEDRAVSMIQGLFA